MLVMRLEVGEAGGVWGGERRHFWKQKGGVFTLPKLHYAKSIFGLTRLASFIFLKRATRAQVRTIKGQQKGGTTETGCKAQKNTRRWDYQNKTENTQTVDHDTYLIKNTHKNNLNSQRKKIRWLHNTRCSLLSYLYVFVVVVWASGQRTISNADTCSNPFLWICERGWGFRTLKSFSLQAAWLAERSIFCRHFKENQQP